MAPRGVTESEARFCAAIRDFVNAGGHAEAVVEALGDRVRELILVREQDLAKGKASPDDECLALAQRTWTTVVGLPLGMNRVKEIAHVLRNASLGFVGRPLRDAAKEFDDRLFEFGDGEVLTGYQVRARIRAHCGQAAELGAAHEEIERLTQILDKVLDTIHGFAMGASK